MDVWISFYNTHMANNIVKWWRNKFLNGYKHFSDCSDVKVSDTEELLGKYNSDDENISGPQEKHRNSNENSQQKRCYQDEREICNNNINATSSAASSKRILEDILCDATTAAAADGEGEETPSPPQRRDKQEFSFTLYDFDGHGKITKDDIAGLVTTIYEALGNSLKVPHCGSKTIKVKLTVSPEQNEKTLNNNNDNRIRYKKDINVTIRQGIKFRSKRNNKHCCRQQKHNRHCNTHANNENSKENEQDSDEFSDVTASASSSDDDEDLDHPCSDSNNFEKTQVNRRKKVTKRRYDTIPLFNEIRNNCEPKKWGKNRSSSLQRRELLGIIQANMDKKTSFQTNRKQNLNSYQEKPDKRRKKNDSNNPESAFQKYLANIVEPSHFYVDLASLQNATVFPTAYSYDKLIDAVIDVSRKTYVNSQGKRRKNIENPNDFLAPETHSHSHSHSTRAKKNNEQLSKKVSKKTHTVTGHTSSPHYMKHRNRQEDQARAMAQVVRWLEREFSTNLTIKEKLEKVKHSTKTNLENENENDMKKNEKHEHHHHIHEHIHHHYHHYRDAPFVI